MLWKCMGFVVLFFRQFGKFLYFSPKFLFFPTTIEPFSTKMVPMDKRASSSMCLHSSLVSFHFTLRSTALESFSRGIFDFTDLFWIFAFSQILNTQIWDECLNKQKQSIAIYLRFTAFESFSGVFLAFWLILKFFSKNYPVKWDKGFNRKCESSLCKRLCPFFKTFFFKN